MPEKVNQLDSADDIFIFDVEFDLLIRAAYISRQNSATLRQNISLAL